MQLPARRLRARERGARRVNEAIEREGLERRVSERKGERDAPCAVGGSLFSSALASPMQ